MGFRLTLVLLMLQNLENESNNGLSDVIEFLENLYGETVTVTTTTTHSVKDLMSRADFWQLAANSATELAITRSNRDELSQTNKMKRVLILVCQLKKLGPNFNAGPNKGVLDLNFPPLHFSRATSYIEKLIVVSSL